MRKNRIVGTSTNCSADCGSRRDVLVGSLLGNKQGAYRRNGGRPPAVPPSPAQERQESARRRGVDDLVHCVPLCLVVVVVVVFVVVSDARATVCVSTPVMTMQQSLRTNGGRSPGSQDSQRPRHPPALDNEELLVIEGYQKIQKRNLQTAENICKLQGGSWKYCPGMTASLHNGHDNNQVHELCLDRHGHVSLKITGTSNNLVQELCLDRHGHMPLKTGTSITLSKNCV